MYRFIEAMHKKGYNGVRNFQQDSTSFDQSQCLGEQFAGMRISDVSSVKTAIEMINYCISLESNFYKNYKGDRKEILRFAEKAVNDFEIYKAKNITAHEEWEKPPLETFYVAYQLMVSMLKFHLKKITIDELDFQLMKEQLLLLFNCEYNKDFLSCIIETLTIDFMGNLLMLFYLKTARVFFNLSIHMTGLCQKRRENLTNQQSPPNEDNKLYEIKYFEPFLHVSCQMMLRDSCWTEEKEAKEAIFEDLLEKLEIDDKYEGIPEMIQTFKQAEKFCKMYLSKIDEYEKLKPIVPDISDRAKELKQFYPMKLRAQAYLTMATFQKDGYKRAELNEQSMKIFNKILEDDFKEEMLQQYEQNDATKHMLTFYSHINIQNSKNYDNVIGVKVDYLLNLPTDAEETKLRLKELNILRRDYAVQMLTFEKFVKRNPEEYPRNNLVRLYVDIATQFRSIVLINQMNKNMEQSFAFLLLAAGVWKELDPSCTENQTLKEVAGSFGYQINQHPFIKKFC